MLLLLSIAASAQCPEGAVWPEEDWPVATPNAAQAEHLAALADYAFSPGEDSGLQTNGLLVIHRGAVLLERYDHGFDEEMRHVGWSVTKSALSLMVGIAERAGHLSLSDSICEHLDVSRPEHCAITIEHTLTFATGLDWTESYDNDPPRESSVANMLFGVGRADALSFVLDHPQRAAPGSAYRYSSGDSVVLSAVLAAAVQPHWGADFLWEKLFEPIGMTSAQVSRDQAGTLLGSSGLHATPRDYARLGYLALRNGCWDGEPLVADDWIARSTTLSSTFLKTPEEWRADLLRPGLSWWLNTRAPFEETPWEGVPETTYGAFGHQGQGVYVLPDHDLIVVRTANDSRRLDRSRFLGHAMAAAEAADPLPAPVAPDPASAEEVSP